VEIAYRQETPALLWLDLPDTRRGHAPRPCFARKARSSGVSAEGKPTISIDWNNRCCGIRRLQKTCFAPTTWSHPHTNPSIDARRTRTAARHTTTRSARRPLVPATLIFLDRSPRSRDRGEIVINKTASGLLFSFKTNPATTCSTTFFLGYRVVIHRRLYTTRCVETTVRDACRTSVTFGTFIEDCCATVTPQLHDGLTRHTPRSIRQNHDRSAETVGNASSGC